MPRGRPHDSSIFCARDTLLPLYAVNPPPGDPLDGADVEGEDDGGEAEGGVEDDVDGDYAEVGEGGEGDGDDDDDWTYDWYTFPRAVAALREHGDEATVTALQSLAFALKGAAHAHVLPSKWGGVFGQEFTDDLTPESVPSEIQPPS